MPLRPHRARLAAPIAAALVGLAAAARAQTPLEPGWTVAKLADLLLPANGLEYSCQRKGFFVSEYGADKVRFVTLGGLASDFASVPQPDEIALERAGSLLVVKEHSTGPLHMFDPATGAPLGIFFPGSEPTGIAFDGDGNFYAVPVRDGDRIDIYPAGTLPGAPVPGVLWASGLGNDLEGLRFTCDGDPFLAADAFGGAVQQVVAPGGPHVAWTSDDHPLDIAQDPCTGDILVTVRAAGRIARLTAPGSASTFASGLLEPYALAFDESGNLYVTEFGGNRLLKFSTPSPCAGRCRCPLAPCAVGGLDRPGTLLGAKSGAAAVFSWLSDPGAAEYHLNTVVLKGALPEPGPHRPPVAGSVGVGQCEAIAPAVTCTDPNAIPDLVPLLFYQVLSACGPSGSEEGPAD